MLLYWIFFVSLLICIESQPDTHTHFGHDTSINFEYQSEDSGSYHQRNEIVAISITRFAYQVTKKSNAKRWRLYGTRAIDKERNEEKNTRQPLKKLILKSFLFFSAAAMRQWIVAVAWKKMFHVGSTQYVVGFKTDLLFLFDSFVGRSFRLSFVGGGQTTTTTTLPPTTKEKSPLKTFIQINAHTLNIRSGNAHAIVHRMKRNRPQQQQKVNKEWEKYECEWRKRERRPQAEHFNQIQYICHISIHQFHLIFRRCIDLTRDSSYEYIVREKKTSTSRSFIWELSRLVQLTEIQIY